MTGSGAIMPQAPSLPSPVAGKIANPAANTAEAEFGAFSELFAALNGELDTPGDAKPDADAPRQESAGPPPKFLEKTAQTRFAEELSATLPLGLAQGNLAPAPPADDAEIPAKTEAAQSSLDALPADDAEPPVPADAVKAALPVIAPLVGATPAQAPVDRETAAVVASPLPGATPLPISANLPASAPSIPIRGPRERTAAKALPHDGSAIGEPTAMSTTTASAAPFAPPAEAATSDRRSGKDGEREGTARDLAALKDVKATVVRQETHFAPAPQQSPAFQIANRIVHEVETVDPAFTAQPAELPKDASSAPLKVLHILLDPPELGALTVRMSLKNDMLHLQIEASRHETARLIERDQDALSGMLRSAGYSVDGLTVQIASGDRGNGAQQSSGGSGFNQAAGQQSAGRQQPEGSGSGQAGRSTAEPERITETSRETDAPGAHGRRGGPVYI
jgi:flagellar hook-length control protein FliK